MKKIKNPSSDEIEKLFKKHCLYRGYLNKKNNDWAWQKCKECILRKRPFYVEHSTGKIERDICFAVWHGIGEKQITPIIIGKNKNKHKGDLR